MFMNLFKKGIRLFFVIVVVLLVTSIVQSYLRIKKGVASIEEAKTEVNQLQNEQKDLEKKLSDAESSEFIEKQLRDQLKLSKEGEIVVILPDETEVKKFAPPRREETEYISKPNWKKWKELFF